MKKVFSVFFFFFFLFHHALAPLVYAGLTEWTALTPGDDTGIKFGATNVIGIAYGNNMFVAGGSSGKASYSTDGINWTALAPGDDTGIKFGTTNVREIVRGNNIFVAVGNSGRSSYSYPASTPSSNSQPSNNSSIIDSLICQKPAPTSYPDLFQINVASTQATLYFAPVSTANNYFISFGEDKNTEAHGALYESGVSTGVLAYTVYHLQPNTTYSFKVRGGNGCMPGYWGNTMQIKTTSRAADTRVFYKNIVRKFISSFPLQPSNTNVDSLQDVELNTASCEHVVLLGDSLWSISYAEYGTGTKYRQIMEENGLQETRIRVGQVLRVGC